MLRRIVLEPPDPSGIDHQCQRYRHDEIDIYKRRSYAVLVLEWPLKPMLGLNVSMRYDEQSMSPGVAYIVMLKKL